MTRGENSAIRNSGQMLIIVLWVMGLTSLAIGALTVRSTHELRLARIPLESVQRRAIAQAALQQAIRVIQQDTQGTPAVDTLQDAWATGVEPSTNQQILQDVAVGSGRFSVGARSGEEFHVGMIDESRKLDLNKAGQDQLQRLIISVDAGGSSDAGKITQAILDWRDEPVGESCNKDQLGYECHNGPFDSVDELRLVPGMTPTLFDALEPYVTIYGSDAVNVNTAEPLVLKAAGLDDSQIDTILQQRDAKQPITSYPGWSVNSHAFTVPVESEVEHAAGRTRVQAVIDRDGRVLAWSPQ